MTSAKIIKHSITEWGQEIVTFEIEHPRMVHADFMTHKVLSKNGSSSRAIPVLTMLKKIWNEPVLPVFWGKNQSGMEAKEELSGWRLKCAKILWSLAAKSSCIFSFSLSKLGLHKQLSNRITEPFGFIKLVVTGTSFDNFYRLRDHEAAQPELQDLARKMKIAHKNSTPQVLKFGEWHLPYIDSTVGSEENLKLSSSLCAQTSYRKSDDSMEKATNIFGRLIDSDPEHFSPTEHQATPLESKDSIFFTHKDKLGRLWSGNFCGWGQYRQKIQAEKKLEPMTCKVVDTNAKIS